jgi:hypothetical protein
MWPEAATCFVSAARAGSCLLGHELNIAGSLGLAAAQAVSSQRQRVDEEAEYESPLTGSWAHLLRKDGDVGSRMDSWDGAKGTTCLDEAKAPT